MLAAMQALPLLPSPSGSDPWCAPVESDAVVRSEVTRVLKALADETRLTLLARIARATGPVCVCDLVPVAGVNQPTVSHHLRVLREAGLVRAERRGPWAYYALAPTVSPIAMATLEALGVAPAR
ncbi:MAG: metalloregulator ArsR/SmtB family transcription factor [Dehalococcoidia bacterium]|nr:metalloregulator ArsR/SmtB family transcription factor [Dehalococcoidia bacterium]